VGGSLVKSRVMLGYDEVEEEMAKQVAGRPWSPASNVEGINEPPGMYWAISLPVVEPDNSMLAAAAVADAMAAAAGARGWLCFPS
jgi:hypothetical protein